ncbi:MAG: tRNA 2-thiocytidine(32) synthetase TtcA [Brachymonas sp.]|nr:tRNA 2-thiocytidine(32) synthetase TtcA [Brachymonas sp.]MBP6967262.1 tRNA 2-thiocytidine(32) synthetase TtcA [Brachymonas sp.]MBP7247440.1 tRNA 2-thiocytidine(32) synthetase TtcA [Brachymonas sp.]MBP7724968.1 tRNA 2-thiocytidine(32) synthetase TtcA [Brachymonas sp.]MBP7734281.1 tRNA 2-thiocytidine(32) synthetase TtcA [Brachymonas sp.]
MPSRACFVSDFASSAADNADASAQAQPATGKHSPQARARREAIKLEKRLCRQTGQAIVDFNMIEEGDKVMVCMSGGKDSYTLLDILLKLQKRAPIRFEIIAVNLNKNLPNFPADVLPAYLKGLGVPFHIEEQDVYSIVKKVVPEGKTLCSLCSRLRRGILYTVARRLGVNKIALGHHRDDIVATFFMNMFFAAKLKAMPPKLVSDDGEFTVIRPLAYVRESDIIRWTQHCQFPIIPCGPMCGAQDDMQRQRMGQMLRDWEKQFPGRTEMILQALQNVAPSHLMDRQLFDFHNLKPSGTARADDGGCAAPVQQARVVFMQPQDQAQVRSS